MRTKVYLTIDTESSMGGAWSNPNLRPLPADKRIFCRIRGVDHGIGWICEALQARGMKATFFCEVLASLVLGETDTQSYLSYLLACGQDVQLHTHPNYFFYADYLGALARGESYDHSLRSDAICRLPLDSQARILDLAVQIFSKLAGRRPTVYRSGGYMIVRPTMRILAGLGIVVDSSFNPVYQGSGSFPQDSLEPNRVQKIEGVYEVPVTVARQALSPSNGYGKLKPFEISALSFWEMRKILEHARESGTQHVVAVFHSFSAVKTKDDQYSRMRPDRIVRSRFERLLDYLAGNSRFQVATLGETAAESEGFNLTPDAGVANLGLARPLARKLVQGINRFYWL
jgi:hypothetical protein